MGVAPPAHDATRADAPPGKDPDGRCAAYALCFSGACPSLALGASVSRHQPEDAATDSWGSATTDDRHDCEPPDDHRGAQSIHPGGSSLLSPGPATEAEQSGRLRRCARSALVGAEARRPPAGLVARGWGGALPNPRVRAVEPSSELSSGRCQVCEVTLTVSRLRDICTYGLTRGCWPVRRCTAGWGLLDPRPGRIAPLSLT